MKNIILKAITSNHVQIHAALAQTLVMLLIELNNLTTCQTLMPQE